MTKPHFKIANRLRDTLITARDRALLALENASQAREGSQSVNAAMRAEGLHTGLLKLIEEYDFEQRHAFAEAMETLGLDADGRAALCTIKSEYGHSLGEISEEEWGGFQQLIDCGLAVNQSSRFAGTRRGIELTAAGRAILMLIPDVWTDRVIYM